MSGMLVSATPESWFLDARISRFRRIVFDGLKTAIIEMLSGTAVEVDEFSAGIRCIAGSYIESGIRSGCKANRIKVHSCIIEKAEN